MAMNRPTTKPTSTDATWRELDEVIEEIAQLAKSEESPGRFYSALLERLVSALAAEGGAIWTRDSGGQVEQQCLVNPPRLLNGEDLNGSPGHKDLIEGVLSSGLPQVVPPQRKASPGDPTGNPTGTLLILFPWRVDQAPAGVIELFQRTGGGPKAEQGYLEFLEVIGEFAAEFQRNAQLRQFKQIARDWARFDKFARLVHAGLDVRRAAYTIVNEGRLLLECDRVGLLVRRGRKYRLTAVSGVESPNQRAELTCRLEELGEATAKTGKPLWFPADRKELSPTLEKSLSEYLDKSHAQSLGILPLAPGKPKTEFPIAILVVEKFFGAFDLQERSLIAEAGDHIRTAIENCMELESVPLVFILRRLRGLTEFRAWLKGALAAAVVAVIVAAALLVKADFNVVAEGELEPVQLRDVFARTDGTVSDLVVDHGQHVRAGELLAVLRRPQLDLEFKQVLGELQTAQQKLVALEAERLQASRDSEEQRRRYGQATAQEEELRETIHSLQAQYEVLKNKQAESEVRSPIDGDVLTWNVRQLLEDRPVTRGQTLLAIGNLSGPWKLALRIPDRQAGHVLAAQQSQPGTPLKVSYLLAMNPRQSFQGTLANLGMRRETAAENPYIEATVEIDRSALEQCAAGAGVRAYIQCGRRSLGYVWLHNLFDTIRIWLFF
jgi:multidrug efflux pump subunit AcrA (membrane-fusion protein)